MSVEAQAPSEEEVRANGGGRTRVVEGGPEQLDEVVAPEAAEIVEPKLSLAARLGRAAQIGAERAQEKAVTTAGEGESVSWTQRGRERFGKMLTGAREKYQGMREKVGTWAEVKEASKSVAKLGGALVRVGVSAGYGALAVGAERGAAKLKQGKEYVGRKATEGKEFVGRKGANAIDRTVARSAERKARRASGKAESYEADARGLETIGASYSDAAGEYRGVEQRGVTAMQEALATGRYGNITKAGLREVQRAGRQASAFEAALHGQQQRAEAQRALARSRREAAEAHIARAQARREKVAGRNQ